MYTLFAVGVLLSCAAVMAQPVNDNCAQAIPVVNGDTPFSTVGATTDGPAHATCGPDMQVNQDIWFQYTATCTGLVPVLLCTGGVYDSRLAVYNGCNCGALSLIACDDNACQFMGLSAITFSATVGNCYLIRVGGAPGATVADGSLSISCGFAACTPDNPNNCFAANASTGCGNVSCCNTVCTFDPFCCQVQWDGICANEATTMCTNTSVNIVSANPPTAAGNPYQPGQPYADVLDTGMGATVTAGIGATGTLPQGAIQYSPIHVTFSGTISPLPTPANVTVTCTGGSLPCPTVTAVVPGGVNEFLLTLSGGIPPLSCTTITFMGTATGEKLQYRSNPGNVNLDAFGATTQDLLFLVQRINDGSANLTENLARYNVNRSALLPPHVNTQDLLRLVQLLNGVNTTQVFNGAVGAACPP
jgi:hypothetical protein